MEAVSVFLGMTTEIGIKNGKHQIPLSRIQMLPAYFRWFGYPWAGRSAALPAYVSPNGTKYEVAY
jgi:hypothetical protein